MCMSGHVHIVQALSFKEVSLPTHAEALHCDWDGVQNTHILWSLLSEVHTQQTEDNSMYMHVCGPTNPIRAFTLHVNIAATLKLGNYVNTECGVAP